MPISSDKRRAVIAAHDGVCFYCGAADATHVDHIVPRACGGTDDLVNLIAACLPCNLHKHRHRLPPEAEQRALAAAQHACYRMIEIKYGMPRGSYLAGSEIPKRSRRKEKLTLRFEMKVDREWLKRLDVLRADALHEGEIPTRADMLRRLVDEMFQQRPQNAA